VAYPDDLLSPSEHVVIHKHPHWKMLLLPVFFLLVIVAVAAFVASLVADTSWSLIAWIALAVIGLVLIGWLTLAPLVRWRTTHFIVTSDRVMAREGVLKRTGLDIPLSRINSVRFEHSLLDRVLGCGTLIIESASDEPLEFDDIPNVERVHSLLYREVNDNPDDDYRPGDAAVTDGRA
jgi:membrane protein YdbS with pleckstrin-like domain